MAAIPPAHGSDPAAPVVYDLEAARLRKARATSAAPDSTDITEAGRELALAHDITVGTADVRQERVEALKQQILDGSYSPDPAAIARRILEDEA